MPGPCSNLIIRKECVSGCYFDPLFSTAADQDYCIQLASKFKGAYISEPLWKYRFIASSMSRNLFVMEKDHIGVFKKANQNKLFKSFWFKQKCFSNLYLILAGSWWVNGQNKSRAIYFIVLSFISYPSNALSFMLKKLFKK